ncbi:unnamed protein product [Fraxinus pennsylvanica]|uniref:AAA+ ATPase domain-containing protein n=1 Tax=Fraxinus pennsylvanica TaxID=56036 RepID=A0AAD2EAB8_9LAMI|nr:unnamed protein product [Fraxinus pennsylvanica]
MEVQQQAQLPGLSSFNNSSTKLKTPEVTFENEFERRIWADIIPQNEIGVKFDDIGALDNVKDALKELPCRGILLFGPPGTGKTMLAKAVATEAGANFLNISISSIASKPAKLLRVVFIDEVDSALGRRNDQDSGITRRIKTEFMVNWDGLRTKDEERILVLAATNRPFDLDEAVIRRLPHRFMVNLPDLANRTKILKIILAEEDMSPDVDIDAIASMTDGFSGSDLKNLCIAAAYCPLREFLRKEKEKDKVHDLDVGFLLKSLEVTEAKSSPANRGIAELRPLNMKDFIYAREQVRASTPADSRIMTELLQWNERYGEGGSQKKT